MVAVLSSFLIPTVGGIHVFDGGLTHDLGRTRFQTWGVQTMLKNRKFCYGGNVSLASHTHTKVHTVHITTSYNVKSGQGHKVGGQGPLPHILPPYFKRPCWDHTHLWHLAFIFTHLQSYMTATCIVTTLSCRQNLSTQTDRHDKHLPEYSTFVVVPATVVAIRTQFCHDETHTDSKAENKTSRFYRGW